MAVIAATGGAVATLPAAAGIRGRQTLDNAVTGKHATVDGEVAANHEGTHGGIFLSQEIRFVGKVRLVLAAIDENKTRVAAGVAIALVCRVYPPSSPAEA